ncbi:MAG: hypothetical protein JXN64_04090 [Spirochaetes bacterium]|nr:hypothetical protein [Spirochaetota bacterium]
MENTKLKEHYSTIKYKIKNFFYIIKSNVSERNRFLMISLASLFLFDYLLFCYISARNPFNIFPSFPLLEDKKLINVYLPDIDGKTILKETREISVPDDKKGYAKILIDLVIKGSIFENTSIAVPITLFNRKIWFSQDMCIIDFVPSLTANTKKNIADSDAAFKEALEKTISENIPSIKKIKLLERGIPGRVMWPQPN